jgi:hypothetical protein
LLSEVTNSSIGDVNSKRYFPWNTGNDAEKYDLAVKDSGVFKSDDWQFPTNKLPTIGWLGRVHRGTPWQTVYLKSTDVDEGTWISNVTSDVLVLTNRVITSPVMTVNDSQFTKPTNDWYLAELFTTAPNANATRGRLSVNQTNLAAWSAVLSGVIGLTNSTPDSSLVAGVANTNYDPLVLAPVGATPIANSAVGIIWNAINRERSRKVVTTNATSGVVSTNEVHSAATFSRLGEILNTPELSVASPAINTNSAKQLQLGINDEVYERLPQQILSLLQIDGTPRFVVYAYGQSLKPADHSIVSSGPQLGLCTNYQITGETALRAVVRIEGGRTNTHAVLEGFNALPPE